MTTDPYGQQCEKLDGQGYCPFDDPTTDPNGQTCQPGTVDASGYCPGDASPSPSVVPVTQVKFVISGYAPADPSCGGGCNPTIDYGSDSSTHNVQEPIDGTVTFTVPFDPNAQYYVVNVSTDTSDSHVTCKIVAVGPSPDVPTTVSSGSETGQAECSAQAAPQDSSGDSWSNEE